MEYYRQLADEEKQKIEDVISLLFRQTYLLEKKYDKKAGRYVVSSEYRVCERHLDFLQEYFQIAGLLLRENRQYGIMVLQSNQLQGEKLTKLTTIFTLLLKLIYDEKMNEVSNTVHVFTTLEELYAKVYIFRLWDNKAIPITEVKKAVGALRKYQVIEVLDTTGELETGTRLLIYPTIHEVINGMDIATLLSKYQQEIEQEEEEDEDGQISGFTTDLL
ncbi:MAG: hypothetical protein PWP24_1399 [Clostridiales bacterium]|nr:hypothetical protein [Clostridiales bacterium]